MYGTFLTVSIHILQCLICAEKLEALLCFVLCPCWGDLSLPFVLMTNNIGKESVVWKIQSFMVHTEIGLNVPS